MNKSSRFGRKLPLPSTAEIKHELRLLAAADELRTRMADNLDVITVDKVDVIIGDLARSHGLTPARARMLMDRFV